VTASLPASQFYRWRDYRCAYELYSASDSSADNSIPLVLLHPIGVGLSRYFWHRFCREWRQTGYDNPIYNPDLLGCGESDMPRIAYTPADWAEQLQYFLQTIVKKPVILLVQGAELAVALALVQRQTQPNYIQGLVLAGPPAWAVMTKESPTWQQKLTWNILDSPVGSAFYRYARSRQFLRSFSERQLFADNSNVDAQWLDTLLCGAVNPGSRYAVFSFLAGFWRQDYEEAIASTTQPTLVVVGEKATSISRTGQSETPEQRLAEYLKHLPQGQGRQIPGRNILPYESTAEFVAVVAEFVKQLKG
jgi:pimeloyl-ACP methyl ester carboxylesterase